MNKIEINGFEAIFDSEFACDEEMIFQYPLIFPELESIHRLAIFLTSMMERAMQYESHCIIYLKDRTHTPVIEIYLMFGLPFFDYIGDKGVTQ